MEKKHIFGALRATTLAALCAGGLALTGCAYESAEETPDADGVVDKVDGVVEKIDGDKACGDKGCGAKEDGEKGCGGGDDKDGGDKSCG